MEGEIRTFKNGAKAVKLPNGRYRIISGPTKGPIGVKKGRGDVSEPKRNENVNGLVMNEKFLKRVKESWKKKGLL